MRFDRPSPRDDYPREKTSPVTWLFAAIIGAYLLELVLFSPWFKATDQIVRGVAVTAEGLSSLHLWTFATYWLLHSQDHLLHVGFVLGGLFFLSRKLEPAIGAARIVTIFLSSTIFGALVWTALNWQQGGVLIGGCAGIYGLLVTYAALEPNRPSNFLLFFFFPVSLKPKYLAVGSLAFELVLFSFRDVFGGKLPFAYAPAAHLGGMMFGWAYFRYFVRHQVPSSPGRIESDESRFSGKEKPKPSRIPSAPAAGDRQAELRIKVDRILDKINSHGFGAVTPEEKQILAQAKESLNRR